MKLLRWIFSLLISLVCLAACFTSVQAQELATEQENEVFEAEILSVDEQRIDPYGDGQRMVYQEMQLKALGGSKQGDTFSLVFNQVLNEGEPLYKASDMVLVNRSEDFAGEDTFYIIEYVRSKELVSLFIIFAVLVIAIGRWRGVASLMGLASSFLIIFSLIIPGIQQGYEPLVVTIVGAALIIMISFTLSHGLNEKTAVAMIGTIVSLVITALLAVVFIQATRLTGFGSEEAAFLQFLKSGQLNIRGLLLAGIIIGTLGVLDDITISQASVVQELKALNPKIKAQDLFQRSMNVGRDHIASLVNTLILVYAGSSLPLLLLFSIDSSRSFSVVVNYAIIAEEIIATMVGSIGIVLAVPITTFIASYFAFKNIKKLQHVTPAHHH